MNTLIKTKMHNIISKLFVPRRGHHQDDQCIIFAFLYLIVTFNRVIITDNRLATQKLDKVLSIIHHNISLQQQSLFSVGKAIF